MNKYNLSQKDLTKLQEMGALEISCQFDRILNSKGRTNERRVQF